MERIIFTFLVPTSQVLWNKTEGEQWYFVGAGGKTSVRNRGGCSNIHRKLTPFMGALSPTNITSKE